MLSVTAYCNNWVLHMFLHYYSTHHSFSCSFSWGRFFLVLCVIWPPGEPMQQEQEECRDYNCSLCHQNTCTIPSRIVYVETWRRRGDFFLACYSVFRIHCVLNQLKSKITIKTSACTLDPILAHFSLLHGMCSFTLNANLRALVLSQLT